MSYRSDVYKSDGNVRSKSTVQKKINWSKSQCQVLTYTAVDKKKLVGSECSQTMIIYYLIVWESDIKVIGLTIGTNSVFITVKFYKIGTN